MGKGSNRRRKDKARPAPTTKTAPAASEPLKSDPPLPSTPFPNSKLTEEITQAICESVAKGLHKSHIAASVGIEADTLRNWLDRGAAKAEGDEAYSAFSVRFKKAQSDFCQARFGTILEASEKTWTAAAWVLERLYPDEYSDPGKELARLRREVDELKKLVPEVQGGDDKQTLFAKAAAIVLSYEPPESEGLGSDDSGIPEDAPLDAETGAAGDSVPEQSG